VLWVWEQPAEQWLFVQSPISREDGSNLGLVGKRAREDMQGVPSGEFGIGTGSRDGRGAKAWRALVGGR
jgi:hypothetical protein